MVRLRRCPSPPTLRCKRRWRSLSTLDAVRPAQVAEGAALPSWACVAVIHDQPRRRQLQPRTCSARSVISAQPERRWSDWKEIACRWAHLIRLQIASAQPLPDATAARSAALVNRLDSLFAEWLQRNYAPLAGQRLPEPHHLFHIPGVLERASRAVCRADCASNT